jgi:chemosensory pili system protein ChpA (sensor histidine kinase/response regulator)
MSMFEPNETVSMRSVNGEAPLLAWVAPEIKHGLDRVLRSLEPPEVSLDTLETLDEEHPATDVQCAIDEIHVLIGVSHMVGEAAIARYLQSLKDGLHRHQYGGLARNDGAVLLLKKAVGSLLHHVSEAIRGEHVSPVAMFPAYRDVQGWLGYHFAHPADLWLPGLSWQAVVPLANACALQPDASVRVLFDRFLLLVLQGKDPHAAGKLALLCAGLAKGARSFEYCTFWMAVAAVAEGLHDKLIELDVYVKRTLSGVHQRYLDLSSGRPIHEQALLRQLLFFCAHASPQASHQASCLRVIRHAYQLQLYPAVSWQQGLEVQLSPEQRDEVSQAVQSAKKAWAAYTEAGVATPQAVLSALNRLEQVLVPLSGHSGVLVQRLRALVRDTKSDKASPMVMEVATLLLYLEASAAVPGEIEWLWATRLPVFASRLQVMIQGVSPGPMPDWVERACRIETESNPIAGVVRELKQSMIQVEQGLETYFSDATRQDALQKVLTPLTQMRGVFGLLSQPGAVRDVEHVHQCLTQLSHKPAHADLVRSAHSNISASIGSLTLLVERLAYSVADTDQDKGISHGGHDLQELLHSPVNTQQSTPASIDEVIASAAARDVHAEGQRCGLEIVLGVRKPEAEPRGPHQSIAIEAPDPEIAGVFKEEAQDLLTVAQETLDLVSGRPGDMESLVTLRRVFHTLKGSARMARLFNVGEMAWQVEQQINELLAQQLPMEAKTLAGVHASLRGIGDIIAAVTEALPSAGVADLQAESAPVAAEQTEVSAAPPTGDPDAAPPRRQVGPVEVSAHLFGVFIAESDVVSQRLLLAIEQWADRDGPLAAEAETCAHTLAGVAGAIGFDELTGFCRLLESTCRHIASGEWHARQLPSDITGSLRASVRDVRTVLHFFAAGMYRRPQVDGLSRLLHQLRDLPKPIAPSAAKPATTGAPLAVEESPSFQTQTREKALDGELHNEPDIDLFPVFEAEAQELMPRLLAVLRQWVAHPEHRSAAAEMQRLLHTLKGSARLAGALRWADQVHTLESQVQAMAIPASPDDLRWLQSETDALLEDWQELCSAPKPIVALPTPEPASRESAEPSVLTATLSERQGAPDGLLWPPHPMTSGARQARTTLRVATDVLDRLVNEAGEIMIGRSRVQGSLAAARGSLAELSANLERLRLQLRDMELQTETQMQSRLALARDTQQAFDPLEFDRFTRVQEITRSMAESVNDVATVQRQLQRALDGADEQLDAQGRQSRALQRDLLGTHLIEFEAMAERLYRVVRQTAKETGKQVRLDIHGGSLDMDRGMLERLTPVFEHLLRNAVVHGVETPEARHAAGKALEGRIVIEVSQLGNDVSMVVSDDGAGLDLSALGKRAEALGLPLPDAGHSDAWAELVFVPGLSTATSLSALAGRGVGMDVVRSEIVSLGGRVRVQQGATIGCRVEMLLPLTTAITQVVTMRVGEHVFGVPATLVETVRRFDAATLKQAYAVGHLPEAGEAAPLFWAGALLQHSSAPQQWLARGNTCVWLSSAGQRVALHVDEVIGSQEVVVKKLGPQLSSVPGLTGMSVLGSGAVALIHNPVVLARLFAERVRPYEYPTRAHAPSEPAVAPVSRQPLVLVVDDSITVRRVTQRLLVREGYRVALAADGLHALELLPRETPAAVLCDIEMPRMDGFDLLRNLRGDARWADLPVIMITSRIADKHRELALSLGANHYLGKPYPEDQLLGLLRHHVHFQLLQTSVL